MPDGPPVFFDLGDRGVANRQCNCTKPIVGDRPQGEAKMSQRPDAKWMRKEDDQLRAAPASGEAVAAISSVSVAAKGPYATRP
jgi:hypothetical protein